MKPKTKALMSRTLSFLLAVILCVPMSFFALTTPASAADSKILCGVSITPCKGNLSNYSFPTSKIEASVNEQLYVNIASTNDVQLKKTEAYVSVNGGSYTMIGSETANNYLRWSCFPYRPTSTGTFTVLVRLYDMNGRSAEGTITVKVTGSSSTSTAFSPVWPAQSANYISTLYYYWNSGSPSPHSTRSNRYNAIDIAGSGNVLATESGKVVSAGWDSGGFGNAVIIKHSNGLYSLYGHLASVSVSTGQSVTRGQVIGVIGSTGNSSGRHLHFELYNPSSYSQVTNPWVNYFQGKVNVVVGGNSRKASASFSSDSASKAWVTYLDKYGTRRSDGDINLYKIS